VRKAVFLDRDGVLNAAVVRAGKPYPPDTLDALEILPGVPEALARLRAAGFLNVVVTNQPDVATGKQRREVVEAMNDRLLRTLPLDAIEVCYHVEADHCVCRKPKPGMLQQAARELDIELPRSFMVGDRWRDIAAGQAVGSACFFVDYSYDERQPQPPFVTVKSLPEAAALILSSTQAG
jgi:D-glycero-D-manno-heptose 1,7-bisphosphate phosphatase